MKQMLLSLVATVVLAWMAPPVLAADCFADYKAKQDNPLRLHYGVVQISGACTKVWAYSEIAASLCGCGWSVFIVVCVLGPVGLPERLGSAGPFYLRY